MSSKTDKDYSPHECWCDTQNNISERCNCMVSEYIEKIKELEAENNRLEKDNERLKEAVSKINHELLDCIKENAELRSTVDKLKGVLVLMEEQWDVESEKLREALEKIIEMNIQTARDKYGDKLKAEEWACVKVARKAMVSE